MCLPEQSARDAALAELARLDLAALDAAALMGQITDLATFISQAQGQLSRLTATLDATSGAAEAGHKSASAFLHTRCGLAPGRAAAVVATARGLAGLEATAKAVDAGIISFDQSNMTGLGHLQKQNLSCWACLSRMGGCRPSASAKFSQSLTYAPELRRGIASPKRPGCSLRSSVTTGQPGGHRGPGWPLRYPDHRGVPPPAQARAQCRRWGHGLNLPS